MRYPLFLYNDESGYANIIPEVVAARRQVCGADIQSLHETGAFVATDWLQLSDTATTVSLRDGRSAQDGPYADTEEQLGGYFVIEVPDLDVALCVTGVLLNLPFDLAVNALVVVVANGVKLAVFDGKTFALITINEGHKLVTIALLALGVLLFGAAVSEPAPLRRQCAVEGEGARSRVSAQRRGLLGRVPCRTTDSAVRGTVRRRGGRPRVAERRR